MNTTIFKNLKTIFIRESKDENQSIVELCITELSAGNFNKAVDLSEELIKKDISDSVGWAIKAITQANLFDYDENLFFLKSSYTSIEEFTNKTKLTNNEIEEVKAIFTTIVLDRTIVLVIKRIEEVIELKRRAKEEQAKAFVANVGAALSYYAGSESKSDLGKAFGYGGALVGVIASNKFNENANLFNNISKGVFGVAIANITMTIESALNLKNDLNSLSPDVRNESSQVLKNWVNMLAILYNQVVENLLDYSKEIKKINVFKSSFRNASLNLINSPETQQFIYLSKILGIDNTISDFIKIETSLNSLNNFNIEDVKSSVTRMHIYAGGLALLTGGLTLFLYPYYLSNPIGAAGQLKKSVNSFMHTMRDFKVSSDKIIIDNLAHLN